MRSFGSLAQEVMDAGVAGVVAMRYNVYVITAAQFVADLYASLVQGQTLGEAVTSGRKQLKDQPLREVAFKPVALQDWLVPVVYEAAPITLFPSSVHSNKLTITLHENDALPATGMLDAQLPKTPDAGFFGRDETLLTIDRAFDHQAIVLLHAFAGSGKTSVAAEFGRWYALTGGVQGPVLFTSFQRYLPLSRVLDKLGQVFERDLERSGIHWLALSDEQRRAVALQVLSQVPVLWIWDNVEPIAGFPDGESQRWSEAEQQELADFLRDARNTKAKFLLTSRRDERGWLGDLPVWVQVPPMPMQEQVQFARALAEKHGYRLTDVGNWLPLLKYTQGNPLTITVVVGQALRNGYRSKEQIEKFVADLRSGEAELDDDESEGRSRSLGASLNYGFANTFNEAEKQQLALLHLFQRYVDLDLFLSLGNSKLECYLPVVEKMSREEGTSLFQRAAEIGLLERINLEIIEYFGDNKNFYEIHPVLSWYFKKLFKHYYGFNSQLAINAFISTMKNLAEGFEHLYLLGINNITGSFEKQEVNLLRAVFLARISKNWKALEDLLRNLDLFYESTGRRLDWFRLLTNVLPNEFELINDESSSENEEYYDQFIQYQADLAFDTQNYVQAEQLQGKIISQRRRRNAFLLKLPVEELSYAQRNSIRSLGVAIEKYGYILQGQNRVDCVNYYQEAFEIYKHIDDQDAKSVLANSLGNAYYEIPTIYNLDKAKHWYQESLRLKQETDFLGRSRCLLALGNVAMNHCMKAQEDNSCQERLLNLANDALSKYHEALELLDSITFTGHPQPIQELALVHNGIGCIYGNSGYLDAALSHYQEAIRYFEILEDHLHAAMARFNIALDLTKYPEEERLDDALLYAQAALRNFQTCGEKGSIHISRTQQLIAEIEQDLKIQGN